jgi:hypothetical protein
MRADNWKKIISYWNILELGNKVKRNTCELSVNIREYYEEPDFLQNNSCMQENLEFVVISSGQYTNLNLKNN